MYKFNSKLIAAQNALANKKAEGYVDSGVKILIAVVIGALLLAGLVLLFNTVIMPSAENSVQGMFDIGNTYVNDAVAGHGA